MAQAIIGKVGFYLHFVLRLVARLLYTLLGDLKMSEKKPPDPNRRRFFEDLFVNLGRGAGKLYRETRRTKQELSRFEEELRVPLDEPVSPPDDRDEILQRFDALEEEISRIGDEVRALIARADSPQALAAEDRERLDRILQWLPERDEELTITDEPEPAAQSAQEEAISKRRRILRQRLWEIIKLIVVWLAASSPDVLYETVFNEEVYPWLRERWRSFFARAEAAGTIQESPLPLPTAESPPPPRPPAERPASPLETPSPARQSSRPGGLLIPELLPVPAGHFWMGSDSRYDKRAFGTEMPQHRVYLTAYRIGKYPVTNAEYACFVAATNRPAPGHWSGGEPLSGKLNHPVVYVTWHDVRAYCDWLSEQTGRTIRLPTEAEWEKAARGTDGRIYPWGNAEPDEKRCNFAMKVGDTTQVGRYPDGASPYGCLDMAGNVREWTSNLHKDYPYDAKDGREDPAASGSRVLRGGSFHDHRNYVRCACRGLNLPDDRGEDLGFRVVSPGL